MNTRAEALREAAAVADTFTERFTDMDAMKAAGLIGPFTMASAIRDELYRMADAAEEKATAPAAPATPEFFQVGHTYTREHHGRPIEFHVRFIDTAPDCDYPTAFGWRRDPQIDAFLPMDSVDLDDWTDITGGGA